MTAAQRRLLAYLDRLEPSVRKDVERALAKLRTRVTVAELVAAIERVDLFALNRLTAGLPRDLQRATDALARAAQAGARVAATMVRGTLQLTNAEAVRVAETQAARLVTGIGRETRKAIRTVVAVGFSDGLSPRDVAHLVKPLIGLTDRQTNAVIRQRRADARKGLTVRQIESRATRYTAKLLTQRATMIARTEIIAASTEGQLALWRQATTDGLLNPAARKRWMVTPDDRLCPRCSALDGMSVPLGQSFTEGRDAVSGPPLHVQCRCTLVIDARSVTSRRVA